MRIYKERYVLKGFELVSFNDNPYYYPKYVVRAIVDIEYKYFWQFSYNFGRTERWFAGTYTSNEFITPKGIYKLTFSPLIEYRKCNNDFLFNQVDKGKKYIELLLLEYGFINIEDRLNVEYTTNNNDKLMSLTRKMINAKADGDDKLEDEIYNEILKLESKNFV